MLEGSILKQLISDRSETGQTPINFGVYYKNTLVALCHALEDWILASNCQPLVITAFQRGRWYLQEAERYGAIATQSQQVVIMASPEAGFHEHPTSQEPNVALVDLDDDDPVAQEWHLMILSPSYSAMVLCQELSEADYGADGPPEHDLQRKFYGFWTFDGDLVRQTVTSAIEHIGRYNAELQSQLQQQLQQIVPDENTSPMHLEGPVTRVVNYLHEQGQTLVGNSLLKGEDLDRNLVSNRLQAFLKMAQLVDLSDTINPVATQEVTALLEMMGQLLDLPAWQLQRLRLAGMLHRVAPSSFEEASGEGQSCPLVPGAQMLRTMPRLGAVATIIAHKDEAWDGSGLPAGLAGDRIPLESRMLGLISRFQYGFAEAQHQQLDTPQEQILGQVLAEIRDAQGSRWDPKLVDMLGLMVKGLQQGLSLPLIPARVTLTSGLLDPDLATDDEVVGTPSSAAS